MELFEKIPDRFFNILASSKKELYIEALFVLYDAFKTELNINKDALLERLTNRLEDKILEADFTEEKDDFGENIDSTRFLSGKVHLLYRKLKETGWLDVEYATNSFEENVTIPSYAVAIISVLYSLTQDNKKEYNSYVYASYAALVNADDNDQYRYQALRAAHQNTIILVEELRVFFNNIKSFHNNVSNITDVNTLLASHFDKYKDEVYDQFLYPLKTIDSVPRFKHTITSILNLWLHDEQIIDVIVQQGIKSRVYDDEESGRLETIAMINEIIDTYSGIEQMIDSIFRKHNAYTSASADRIRYLINTDRSIKGKLIEILKCSGGNDVVQRMQNQVNTYRHTFYDKQSLYVQRKERNRSIDSTLKVERKHGIDFLPNFLVELRKQYSTARIDTFMESLFQDRIKITTDDVFITESEEFILFMLATMRATEISSPYTMTFLEGETIRQGYKLPCLEFVRKGKKRDV